jgi:hypothetical protein
MFKFYLRPILKIIGPAILYRARNGQVWSEISLRRIFWNLSTLIHIFEIKRFKCYKLLHVRSYALHAY